MPSLGGVGGRCTVAVGCGKQLSRPTDRWMDIALSRHLGTRS